MKEVKTNKWLQLVILAFGGGAIYQLPYMRLAFYTQLQNALGLNNFQYGLTMSVYAIIAMACYFPGGWLADGISPKKLITFSLISTGISGFLYATFPSYPITIALHAFWGLTTILTYWPALLKITRTLGDDDEQGRLYGSLEGMRGLFSALGSFALLAVLTSYSSSTLGMAAVIRIMSWLQIILGIATLVFVKDPEIIDEDGPKFKDIKKLLKRKDVWMIVGIIFSAYSIYAGLTYVAPYLQTVYGASEEFSTTINLIQRYVMMLLGGVLGGVIADKIGSRSKVMYLSFILLVASIVVLIVLLPASNMIIPAIIFVMLMAFSCYSLRGLYFSLTSELKIPLRITGTVVGFASLLGYLPDVFIYPIIGRFLDKYDGTKGYLYTYTLLLVLSAIGLFVMIAVRRYMKSTTYKNKH